MRALSTCSQVRSQRTLEAKCQQALHRVAASSLKPFCDCQCFAWSAVDCKAMTLLLQAHHSGLCR